MAYGQGYGVYQYGGANPTPPAPPPVGTYTYTVESTSSTTTVVTFSEAVNNNADVTDVDNYTLAEVYGVVPAISAVEVLTTDMTGVLSVELTHAKTTYCGKLSLVVSTIETPDSKTPDTTPVEFLTLGNYGVTCTTTHVGASTLRLSFSEDLLGPEENPSIEYPSSYVVETDSDYFIGPFLAKATHAPTGDLSVVDLTVYGLNTFTYDLQINPSDAISYNGTVLPSAATSFDGNVSGTGTSVAGVSGLLLSKAALASYGWDFVDTSGLVTDTASFRCHIQFKAFSAFPGFAGDGTPVTFEVSDNTLGMQFAFGRSGADQQLTVSSGAYTQTFNVTWLSNAFHTLDVVRNPRSDFIGVLFDGVPLLSEATATMDGVRSVNTGPGVTVRLASGADYLTSNFNLKQVVYTASDTLYTVSGNFIHSATSSVLGLNLGLNDTLITEHGPLVKNWGSDTPATKNDVTVTVQGVSVDVAEVNPYTGAITLDTALPLMPPFGTLVVTGLPVAGETITIDGVVLTAVAGAPGVDEYQIGGSVTATATNIGAAINDVANSFATVMAVVDGATVEVKPLSGQDPTTMTFSTTSANISVSGSTLAIPVDVSYYWMPSPTFEMLLDIKGSCLDTVVPTQGHHYPSVAGGDYLGTPSTRFPMTIVLPGLERAQPKYISHRYIGFEKAYTAALDSPTTLLLDMNPHSVALPKFQQVPSASRVGYEATTVPTSLWSLIGSDSGVLGSDSNFLSTPGSGQTALYYKAEDLVFPSTLYLGARLLVSDYTLDGVFSGVGFGAHDRDHLYYVGLLEINGVKHVGVLKDGTKLDAVGSWEVGPSTTLTITGTTTFTTVTASTPQSVGVGDRVQILTGNQVGVYTLTSVTRQTTGVTTFTVSTAFPANYTRFGNKTATGIFEMDWSKDATYRMVVNTSTGACQALVAGEILGTVAALATTSAYPTQIPLTLPNTTQGGVFWGHLSKEATATTSWSLVRYGIQPALSRFAAREIVVSAEMTTTPEADSNHIWFRQQDFGYAEIDGTGTTLLLKNTSSSDVQDESFSYERVEPYFSPGAHIDVESKFKSETGVLGAGDARIVLNDGNREACLSALTYVEDSLPLEITDTLPQVRLEGDSLPDEVDWSKDAGFTLDSTLSTRVFVQDGLLTLDQQIEPIIGAFTVLSVPAPGDTITVGAQTLTAVAGAPGVNQFQIGADVFETATNLADAINDAGNLISNLVEANAIGFVVDLVSLTYTNHTLSTSNPAVILRSGATMTGTIQTGTYSKVFDVPGGSHTGRLIEAKFRVVNYTPDDYLGTYLAVAVGAAGSQSLVGLRLREALGVRYVGLHSGDTLIGAEIPFEWADDAFHTYHIVANPVVDEVHLFVDGVWQAVRAFSAFVNAPSTDNIVTMGSKLVGLSVIPLMTVTEWEYFRVAASPPVRRLLQDLPIVSFNGLNVLTDDGWVEDATVVANFDPITVSVNNNALLCTSVLQDEIRTFRKELSATTLDQSRDSYVIEFRLKIHDDYVVDAGTGFYGFTTSFAFQDASLDTYAIEMYFYNLLSPTMQVAGAAPVAFDWTDAAFHTYRIVANNDTNTITFFADDTLLLTTTYAGLPLVAIERANKAEISIGSVLSDTGTLELDYLHVHALPRADVKRTLGIRIGSDETDIESWKLPRTDFTDVLNSDMSAVVEEMDWTSYVDTHLHWDATWGVVLKRPDLAAPPQPIAPVNTDFATQQTRPFDGWINVEYPKLPRNQALFGSVNFGSPKAKALTQQRWKYVRYHIYEYVNSDDVVSPHHMVLDQYNVVTSGEHLRDITPEVLEVTSLTSTLVSLKPTHIYADRVFSISVNGTVIPMTGWTFDTESQTIILSTPLGATHTVVRVTFAPGKVRTNTYLESQPVTDGVTLLNEGTPPYIKSLVGYATSSVNTGSLIEDPEDLTDPNPDYVVNTSVQYVSFADDPAALYEAIEFSEVDDGGLDSVLSSVCDGNGAYSYTLSGNAFGEIGFGFSDNPGGAENQSLIAQGSGSMGGVLGLAILCPTDPQQRGFPRVLMYDETTLMVLLDTTLETQAQV